MSVTEGQWLYCKTNKYHSGTVLTVKKNCVIIDWGGGYDEVSNEDLNYHFSG